MHKTVVLNIVGLTAALIGQHTPRLRAFRDQGALAAIEPTMPAVTCTAQATYLTGTRPSDHGIVGNGWYFRDTQEIRFWQQADALVQRPRIWDIARQHNSRFTCANLFWWYAMYCGAEWTVTPRPMYPINRRKIPDIWTNPPGLRRDLQDQLGPFPLFKFWGPAAGIQSSRWIARAAVIVDQRFDPTLSLVYLPHLDYSLQKHGPRSAAIDEELEAIDEVTGEIIEYFRGRGARVLVLSEYGIVPVNRPVHINRLLRQAGLLEVREELGTDRLDPGASRAFAVADHQIAHIYVRDRGDLALVGDLLRRAPGVARLLDEAAKQELGLDHPRSGELVALAEPDSWFSYYFWMDDRRAPDYARTVDIHRKPGYDPVELFLDPTKSAIKARLALKLLARKLGFSTVMDVIPLDAALVKGSHGAACSRDAGPALISDQVEMLGATTLLPSTGVAEVILRHVMG